MAPIRGRDTLTLATTETGNLLLAGGDLIVYSPLREDHRLTDQLGELVEDWLFSHNAQAASAHPTSRKHLCSLQLFKLHGA